MSWIDLLRDDDLVVIPQGTAEPLGMTEELVRLGEAAPAVRIFVGVLHSRTFDEASRLRFVSFGAMGTARKLLADGRLDVVPTHISQVPTLFEGRLKPDVVLLHLSGESRDGEHSVGIVDDYLAEAVKHARVVIAQVNERMPFTHGSTTFKLSDLDAVEWIDSELLESPDPVPTPDAQAVAGHLLPYIPDYSCLQVGIGAIPSAVIQAVSERRGLGIHSGLMTDALLRLHRSDAVTNEHKAVGTGVSIVGAAFGTRWLYDQIGKDESVQFAPVTVTHNLGTLSQIDTLISINSAVEVDLTGQVNGEVAGSTYIGGVGGQVDFVRGAAASRGGRSIIALPATAARGTSSRIVVTNTGGVTTTARSDVDIVATEFGVAELRGRSLRERPEAMIAVAHPDFRDALRAEVSQTRGVAHVG